MTKDKDEKPKDEKPKAEAETPKGTSRMETIGAFKKGGKVYPPGSEVTVSAEDVIANPGNFRTIKKQKSE